MSMKTGKDLLLGDGRSPLSYSLPHLGMSGKPWFGRYSPSKSLFEPCNEIVGGETPRGSVLGFGSTDRGEVQHKGD